MSQYSILIWPDKFDGEQVHEFSNEHEVKSKVWRADVDEETVAICELTNFTELSPLMEPESSLS
jgi:hypothetical protein